MKDQIEKALQDKRGVADDRYFLSCLWASERNQPGTEQYKFDQQTYYRFLLAHTEPNESMFVLKRGLIKDRNLQPLNHTQEMEFLNKIPVQYPDKYDIGRGYIKEALK